MSATQHVRNAYFTGHCRPGLAKFKCQLTPIEDDICCPICFLSCSNLEEYYEHLKTEILFFPSIIKPSVPSASASADCVAPLPQQDVVDSRRHELANAICKAVERRKRAASEPAKQRQGQEVQRRWKRQGQGCLSADGGVAYFLRQPVDSDAGGAGRVDASRCARGATQSCTPPRPRSERELWRRPAQRAHRGASRWEAIRSRSRATQWTLPQTGSSGANRSQRTRRKK